MMLGALSIGLACFAGLQALFGRARPGHSSGIALIRATTLSPVEWRQHQRGREDWYQRWLRPIALLWGSRLHLRPTRLDPIYLIQAGIDPDRIDGVELGVVRLMSALVGGLIACLIALLASGALVLVPLLVWAGYIAPARYLAQRRRLRQNGHWSEPCTCCPRTRNQTASFGKKSDLLLVAMGWDPVSTRRCSRLAREPALTTSRRLLGRWLNANESAVASSQSCAIRN